MINDMFNEPPLVRFELARCENTSSEILRKLAEDNVKDFGNGEFVKNQVARNSNTPVDILQKFAESDDSSLRIDRGQHYKLF